MKLITTFLFAFLFSFASLAQSTTWTGLVSSDWSNSGNWNGGVPNLTTTVSIFSSPNNPVINGVALAQQIIVSPGASLTVTATGNLTIDKSGSTDMLPGLLLNDDVINDGVINIDFAFNGILINSTGMLTNSGIINIGLSGTIDSHGLYNDGVVINNPLAEILIDDANSGLVNFNGNFTNRGTIKIGEFAGIVLDGIGNYNQFDNYDQIEIFTANRTGLRTYNSGPFYGIFVNHTDGIVEIGSSTRGVRNEGTLTNFGEMIIDDIGGISFFAIDNRVDGIFENKECAYIECNYKLQNTSFNAFENDGLFVLDSPIGSTIGLFNNNGIVNDLNKTFFSTATTGYSNNGIFLESTTTSTCSTTATYSFQVQGNYFVEGVYLDMSATSPAGLYNVATNTFNFPNLGQYSFFVKYENLSGACSAILPWSINVVFNDTITFTGNGDGVDWHDPLNWDLGIVPDVCHHVIIPQPFNVVVAPNALGVGRTLCVDLNADLDVPLLAELEIITF